MCCQMRLVVCGQIHCNSVLLLLSTQAFVRKFLKVDPLVPTQAAAGSTSNGARPADAVGQPSERQEQQRSSVFKERTVQIAENLKKPGGWIEDDLDFFIAASVTSLLQILPQLDRFGISVPCVLALMKYILSVKKSWFNWHLSSAISRALHRVANPFCNKD
jgi:hypothetical protein